MIVQANDYSGKWPKPSQGRDMTLKPNPFLYRLAMAGLALGLAGCSVADKIGNLNPFNRGEDLMPGDRRSVLAGTGDALAGTVLSGKTATISAAVALSDWSQPGGNAANAPGKATAGLMLSLIDGQTPASTVQ